MKMQLHKKEFSNKDGLISESFSFWPKNVPKCILRSTWRENTQNSFWHICWDIWAKLKNLLRLSHLYKGMKHLVGWISDSRPWSFFWKLPLGLIQTKCFKLSREKKCTSFIHHEKKNEQQKLSLEATYYLYCNVKQEEEDVARAIGSAMNFNAIRHLMQM